MNSETESCQLTDTELLGALYLSGTSVNPQSPLSKLTQGPVGTPPSEQVHASLMRKGLLGAPNTVNRTWSDVLQILGQPLWSIAVVVGSHQGFSFYEYFSGGSLRAPRLVCHRADDEGTHHVSFFYALDGLLEQIAQAIDLESPVARVLPVGDFSPKEFMVATTLLDVYRSKYLRALLERSLSTPAEFTGDDLMGVFNDGLRADDTRWLVTLCNASLPFDYQLTLDEAVEQLHTMVSRGWVEVVSEQAHQYRVTDSLAEIGRALLLPISFAAFKVEQLLDGTGQDARSISAMRTPQSIWLVEHRADSGPVRVSLNAAAAGDVQMVLDQIVEDAERRTPALANRITPAMPRPAPAPPVAPISAPTVLPTMPPGATGFQPPGVPGSPMGAPPMAQPPPGGQPNGPALLRRRPDQPGTPLIGSTGPEEPSPAWSGSTYGVPDNGRTVPVGTQPEASAGDVKCVHCGQMINPGKKFCRYCGGATADSLWSANPTDSGAMSPPAAPPQAPPETPWGTTPAFGSTFPSTPPAPTPAPATPAPWGAPVVPPAPTPPATPPVPQTPAAPVWGGPPPAEPAPWPTPAWGGAPAPAEGGSPWPPPSPGGFAPGSPVTAPPPNIPPSVPFGTSPGFGSGFAPMPPSAPPPVPTPPSPVGAAVAAPAQGGAPGGMVPCPVCQGLVNEKARFCGHCGTNIAMQRTEAAAPTPSGPPSGERTCSGCGFKTNKPATFCPNCGTRFG